VSNVLLYNCVYGSELNFEMNKLNLEINKSPIKKIIIKIKISLNLLKLKINKMSSFKNT